MDTPTQWLLILLIFGAVTALVLGAAAVIGGAGAQRLRTRLLALRDVELDESSGSAIRVRYLRQLPPLERWLEQQPGMAWLGRVVEQAGRTAPAYRVALLGLALGVVAALLAGLLAKSLLAALVAGLAGTLLPLGKLNLERSERLRKFEEQLPDALDLMTRSLRAGNPLLESMKFVGDEMHPPISSDFNRAWSHVNYGVGLRASLLDLLERSPSTSLRAMVTAILVQRETGGNLAEVLDKITAVLRARAKFQRRLRTLSAEGRMSALVLTLMPFGLAVMLSVSSPGYLPMLVGDPSGRRMIVVALALMMLGIFWVSRIVKIRV